MIIGLNRILDLVSNKTGVDKKQISFNASFDDANVDVGKNCERWRAKAVCVDEFYRNPSQGLLFRIYVKGYEVLRFYANDIEPYTNDICDIMRVDYVSSCVGPGFYSYSPYLVMDSKCDKNDLKKFKDTISINPDKMSIVSFPKKSYDHLKFLRSLPTKAISRTLFNSIKSAKEVVDENASGEQRL